MFDFLAAIGDWSYFTVRAMAAGAASCFRPGSWLKQLYDVLIGGLPLAVVLGLSLGIVIWTHTRGILARTGPDAIELLPTFLAAAVLLELSPIGAGLILAARTGARLGAEIASMKIGEQVDALAMMGVSPMRKLVGPRLTACFLAAPILHVIISLLAIGSGFCAESMSGSSSWRHYRAAVLRELTVEDVVPASLKTLAFGVLVGSTGCWVGLKAREDAEGVGRAATNAVVLCSLAVLIADVLLVGIIRVLF